MIAKELRNSLLPLEVVVAQLVEWSILIPEVHGSNPVMGKYFINIEHVYTVNCVLERRK